MKIKRLFIALLAIVQLSASAQVLYKVEGKDLKNPSYIFGTHHVAPLSTIKDFGADAPFESVTQVVGEIDMTQDPMTLATKMQSHMIAPSDSALSKLISPEDYAIIASTFKEYAPMPGMELQMLDMMKPNAITSMVAVGMAAKSMEGYNPTEQLDTWFQTQGKSEGKTIVPLETAEYQATVLFDTTPITYQAEALVEMLKNPEKAIQATNRLTEAYKNQDLDAMLKLTEDEDAHPEFMKALLDNRNADWLSKLPSIMQQGSSFIAVGALHLAGDKGIVEGLRNLGYTVTPISNK